MKVELVDCPVRFANLKDSWNRLTEEPLLRWEWHHAWWNHFGEENELAILVIHGDDSVIRGIAPMLIERRYGEVCLRFIGSGDTCTDYLRVICETAYQEQCDSAFANFITQRTGQLSGVSVVEFEGVAADSSVPALADKMSDQFWQYGKLLEFSWVLTLGSSWDDFVSGSHRGLRRKIRKASKRFASGQATVASTRDGLDFERAFETLVDLHQARFESKGELGVFANTNFRDFLFEATQALAEEGRAEISVCSVDDQPLVVHLYLVGPNGRQLYQSGMDITRIKLEPGHLLFAHTIAESIDLGHSHLDFLRGDEPYKQLWGATSIPLMKIRCVSNALPATVKHRMIQNITTAKQWWDVWNTTQVKPAAATVKASS